MANADQLKALLKSHFVGDTARFNAVAMQVAAGAARQGHGKLADELRKLIDQAKSAPDVPRADPGGRAVPISRPKGELGQLIAASYPRERLADIVLDESQQSSLKRIIREQRRATDLLAHGLAPRRKILLVGAPGTGKTLTASVLAGELGLPLMQVRLDALITKFMGETASKLRQIFDATTTNRAVYFFDEFDAIGSQRGLANDVGEIRRVLNSFLQMIEQDESHSLIVCATNHPEILDHALFRRFDDVLHYEPPNQQQIETLLRTRLTGRTLGKLDWKYLANAANGLSHAEVTRAAEDAIKQSIIAHKNGIAAGVLEQTLEDRHKAHKSVQRYRSPNE